MTMTREEAIETLGHVVPFATQNGEKIAEAIDMAIEALQEVQKHEKTFEWCHDCKEYDTDNHCCHRWSKVIRNTGEELKADRPHGEWVFHVNFSDESQRDDYDLICTNCGELYRCDCQDDVNDFVWNAHYCMNCGAYMGGARKNEM